MNQLERVEDNQIALRVALTGLQTQMWSAMPAIVESYDPTTMTISAQPAIQFSQRDTQGNITWNNFPLCTGVPLVLPGAGGFCVTFPLEQGDEVLLVFGSRAIDNWKLQGGVQLPPEPRMHDLSDGFAIPGPRSLPNVPSDISTSSIQIRTADGTAIVSVDNGGNVNVLPANNFNVTTLGGETLLTGDLATTGNVSSGNGFSGTFSTGTGTVVTVQGGQIIDIS